MLPQASFAPFTHPTKAALDDLPCPYARPSCPKLPPADTTTARHIQARRPRKPRLCLQHLYPSPAAIPASTTNRERLAAHVSTGATPTRDLFPRAILIVHKQQQLVLQGSKTAIPAQQEEYILVAFKLKLNFGVPVLNLRLAGGLHLSRHPTVPNCSGGGNRSSPRLSTRSITLLPTKPLPARQNCSVVSRHWNPASLSPGF